MENEYPLVGFHFMVDFHNLPDAGGADVQFQSVEGLEVETEKEYYREGGENRFVHVLPGKKNYSPLLLKRGILTPANSGVTKWLQRSFQNSILEPLDGVQIILLNENHEPLLYWRLFHVWPLSWTTGKLDAQNGKVLIETLELNYNRFELGPQKTPH